MSVYDSITYNMLHIPTYPHTIYKFTYIYASATLYVILWNGG